MDDLISRQAAIDAIAGCTNCGDEEQLRKYVVKHGLENGWTGGVLDALDAIEDLPPAQPEKPTEKRTETHACDSISRQAAIDAFEPDHRVDWYTPMIIDVLKALPSAEPKLKCDSCRYRNRQRYEEPCDSCTMGGEGCHYKPERKKV